MKIYNRKYKLAEKYGTFMVDLFSLFAACVVSKFARMHLPFGNRISSDTNWAAFYMLCLLGCVFYNLMMNRYRDFFGRGFLIEAEEVLKYNLFQFVLFSTCVYIFRLEVVLSRLLLGYFLAMNCLVSYLVRCLYKTYIRMTFRKSRESDKVLLVTTRQGLEEFAAKFQERQEWSYEIVGAGVIDCDSHELESAGYPIVAGYYDLLEKARQLPIDLVVFYDVQGCEQLENWIQAFVVMGVKCYNVMQTVSLEVPYSGIGSFGDLPVMCYSMPEWDFRKKIIKRLIDIIGGIVGLAITAVLTPLIAAAIKLDDPKGKVFFRQMRVGKNGRRFWMYKFRSMCFNAEELKKELEAKNEMKGPLFKMEEDPRITRVGRFLRRTSLDELPQFWNILKGDMSLVGTRPPTVEEFEQYNDYYRRRLSITPGLTGLWQVSGRNDIKDFDEIVRMDLQYIDNWSLRSDIKIILKTAYIVFKKKGAR